KERRTRRAAGERHAPRPHRGAPGADGGRCERGADRVLALDAPRPPLGLRALHRRRAPGFGWAVRVAAQSRGRAARRSGLADVLYAAAVLEPLSPLRRSPAAMAARAEGAGSPPAAPRGRHGPPRA